MEKVFHDFRIETDETGTCKRIYIDGIEQKGVIACDIRLRPEEIPLIQLQYNFMNIEAALSASTVQSTKTFTDGVLDKGIEELDLSVRAYNCIKKGYWDSWTNRDSNNTIADVVVAYRTGHLKKYRNMGSKSYEEVLNSLKRLGLLEEDAE